MSELHEVLPVRTGKETVLALTSESRFLRFCRSALIVGGAILVWLAIVGAVASSVYGVWLLHDWGGGPAMYTDRNGNTCLKMDTSAIPDGLLCPASIGP